MSQVIKKRTYLFYFVIILSVFPFILAIESGCCEKTMAGSWCINGPASCDSSYGVSPNSCQDAVFCKTGYCYDSNEGICSSGATEKSCKEEGGEWSSDKDLELCQQGCCYFGDNTLFVTESRCNIISERRGLNFRFDNSVQRSECKILSNNSGACLFDGACKFQTEIDCSADEGEFHIGVFCSDLRFNLSLNSRDHSGCFNGDIYWYDSKGNRESIEQDCSDSEICRFSEGKYICADTKCWDEKNNKYRQNGESWCRYDTYVGDSLDPIGSEHCRLYCDNGEVKLDECGSYRSYICSEKIENGISSAKMRKNLAADCLNIEGKEGCSLNPDCRLQNTCVDTYFCFDVCVPKYPIGFDISSQNSINNGRDVCGLASLTCYVAYDKDSFLRGDDDCVENCDCETSEFRKKMTKLCNSMGDCGVYVNYASVQTETSQSQYYLSVADYCNSLDVCNGCENFTEPDKSIFTFMQDYEEEDREEWCKESKDFCDKNGQCFNGKFFLHAYDLEDLDKPNIIGENTPAWIFKKSLSLPYPDSLFKFGNFDLTNFGRPSGDYDEDIRRRTFTCSPSKPPFGGDDCEKCNNDPLIPCDDYRCRSLGKSCEILDETRNTEKPICFNIFKNDSSSPAITFKSISGGNRFTSSVNGVQIKDSSGNCIEKYKKINFEIQTNERAICRWGLSSQGEYESLPELMISDQVYDLEHRIENLSLSSDERLRIFIKCADPNGNFNINDFIVDICISPQPDISETIIDSFVPSSSSYIKKDSSNISFEAYLNEPSECRYDIIPGTSFEAMPNKMACNKLQLDAVERTCSSLLENLMPGENKIYIKCNDTSGNINSDDWQYIIFVTEQALAIDSIKPENGTSINRPLSTDNPLFLEVKTSGGAFSGNSECRFEFENESGWRDNFPEPDSTSHSYSFTSNIPSRDYFFRIMCTDKAGNTAEGVSWFTFEFDSDPPKIIRIFKNSGFLTFTTDEEAICYYGLKDCNFNAAEGNKITVDFSLAHKIKWDASKTYFIKCKNRWDNINSGCSAVIRPSLK